MLKIFGFSFSIVAMTQSSQKVTNTGYAGDFHGSNVGFVAAGSIDNRSGGLPVGL